MQAHKALGFLVLAPTIILTALSLLPCTISPAMAGILLQENFDSYPIGKFPTSGGWVLRYSGAAAKSQHISNLQSLSAPNALRLVGSSCWAAAAYHDFTIQPRIRVEASVFVNRIVTGGCTPYVASVQLENPQLGPWGTSYGRVLFKSDGKIYAGTDTGIEASDILIMPYVKGQWYKVTIDIDLEARSFNVYINGVLKVSDVQFIDTGMPTGVEVQSGHGSITPIVWFDDIKVSSLGSTGGCATYDGKPLTGRKVILTQPNEPNQTTNTNANGCYEFDAIIPGKAFSITIRGPVAK